MYLTYKKRIAGFVGHEFIKIKKDIENAARKFASFQVT